MDGSAMLQFSVQETGGDSWELLAVVWIRRERKPRLADTFEAAKGLQWQPRQNLHHQIIS
jgi:hypothetical protein